MAVLTGFWSPHPILNRGCNWHAPIPVYHLSGVGHLCDAGVELGAA